MRNLLTLSAIALFAGGCQVLSYTWVTPATVAPGSVFTMELSGSTTNFGVLGVVFQVPNGFTVLGASVLADAPLSSSGVVRDWPALLAVYTPDPGHYLASFSGVVASSAPVNQFVRCRVYVRAPDAPGSHQFEMALATGPISGPLPAWAPQLGLNSFQTPGGSVVRALQVSSSPAPPPFVLDTTFLPVPSAQDFEAGDLNGDGRADLLVSAGYIWLHRSIPGAFAPGVGVPSIGGSMVDSAIADFDGDGFADVALANGTVLFGDGGASWTTEAVHTSDGTAVAAGDVDGDGLADLVWSNSVAFTIRRGQANRTFLPWSTGLPATGTAASVRGIRAVDLDADGRREVLVLGANQQTRVYASTGAGVWSLVATFAALGRVVAIDVDGNGTSELLHCGSGALFAYATTGLTAFGASGVAPCADAVAADFDRDGRDDVAISVGGGVPRVELWQNTGAGSFALAASPPANGFEAWTSISSLAAADFDGDTYPDLAAVADGRMLVWHNTTRGVAPFGEGCGPAGAVPDLSVIGSVLPGQSGTLQIANAGPQGATLLWLGASRTLWNGQPVLPLDLGIVGAPGCTLFAEPLAIAVLPANGSGVAILPFTVPLLPPTAEVTMFAQGAVFAPAANPLGLVFSRGLALKIQ